MHAPDSISPLSPTAPMSVRLNADTRQRLKAIAQRQKRSAHALAAEAVEQLVAQKEREFAWGESCDAALQHVDETGLHATHDEVMAWMDSWGTDKELSTPVCHP